MVSKWRIRTIVIPLFIKTTTGWGGGWLGYCGKYIGLIFGQDLVNGWVNFHFLSGTSLTQNIWLYYAGSRDLVWYREQYSSRREHTTQDEWMSKVNSLLYLQGKKVIVVFFASQRSTLAYSHTTVWKLNCDPMKIEIDISQHPSKFSKCSDIKENGLKLVSVIQQVIIKNSQMLGYINFMWSKFSFHTVVWL